MTVDRRDMMRMGAAGVGSVMMASAASSQVFRDSILTMPPARPVERAPWAPVSARPMATAAAPAGLDPMLFARARAALDRHGIARRDFIGIADFSKDSGVARFHVVHLLSGTVESHHVAHGRGSDPDHSGYVERFSNVIGSEATSNGAYTTGSYYQGKYGLSMKVDGLDPTNSNALARAIVIHNAWYAEPDMLAQHGKLGRSEGCFAFSRRSQWDVMHRLEGGRMIFADKLA